MRHLLLIFTLASTLLMLTGCRHTQAPGTDGLGFTTDADAYPPGAQVELQLKNRTDHVVGYNLCFATLERQTAQDWEPVPDPETVCAAVENGLEPGEDADYARTLPSDLADGTYRFTTEVTHRDVDRREMIETDAFVVAAE